MKRLAFIFSIVLFAFVSAAEDTNDFEEESYEVYKEPEITLTPFQQILKYRDDVCSYYNMTNNLKEVIVIMHPILAEMEMAELFLKDDPKPKDRQEFLKKWGARYKQILTNGFGFRLTFQLRNNFLDVQKDVTIPADIANYFTLLSSDGVRVRACRCVSDFKLPQTICFQRPEVNVDLYFNTRGESGRHLIGKKTRAIRLQSSAVNADFGSYNFSWWLPFQYPVKRPANMRAICGDKPFRTFVSVHPEVYCEKVAYSNEGRGAAEDLAKAKEKAAREAEVQARIAAKTKKEVPPEERRAFMEKTIAAAFFYGLLAD